MNKYKMPGNTQIFGNLFDDLSCAGSVRNTSFRENSQLVVLIQVHGKAIQYEKKTHLYVCVWEGGGLSCSSWWG